MEVDKTRLHQEQTEGSLGYNMDSFREEAEGSMPFGDHRCLREDKLAEWFEHRSATTYSSPEPEDPK